MHKQNIRKLVYSVLMHWRIQDFLLGRANFAKFHALHSPNNFSEEEQKPLLLDVR